MEEKTMSNKEDTIAFLKSIGLEYKVYNHKEAKSMEALAAEVNLDHAPLIKNLFYKIRKRFYLILAHTDTKVERGFWSQLKENPKNARMSTPKYIKNILGAEPGHVNPFGLVNDHDKKVTLVIDEKLKDFEYWAFHPMECTALFEMKQEDFVSKFLVSQERELLFLNLTEVGVK
jgi:hypothetical protein